MIVGDLLDLPDLPLGLAWGTAELLERQVTGVTSTDLQDPARYLQPGELVLSGLVWWSPEAETERTPGAALRFATSLSSARVAALLAGESTHGQVPPSLVDACRVHGIPLIAIPAGTSFRAVTDRIYLRLWGELNAGAARAGGLPESARRELAAMLAAGTPPARVLARAVGILGLPRCALRAASGRLIAASDGGGGAAGAGAGAGSAHADLAGADAVGGADTPAAGATSAAAMSAAVGAAVGSVAFGDAPAFGGAAVAGAPGLGDAAAVLGAGGAAVAEVAGFAAAAAPTGGDDTEHAAGGVRVPVGTPGTSPFDGWYLTGSAPSPALADLLAPLLLGARALDSRLRAAASHLLGLLAAAGTADPGAFTHALGASALPAGEPLTTLTARIDHAPPGWAADALTELLLLAGARFAAGTDERGEAAAVVAGGLADLRPLLPGLQALLGRGQVLRVGVGPAAEPTVPALRVSLTRARYALAAAEPYADASGLASLAALLAGIPAPVTDAFHQRLLGPLLANDRENTVSLLETLAVFLEHDASWSRTAKALHVHVNTVHYRARRIEELTGRSLVRLADQVDLRAALLCAPRR